MLSIYCEACGDKQPVEIEPLSIDDLNPDPWGDMVCKTCCLVVATLGSDVEGEIIFVETTLANEEESN